MAKMIHSMIRVLDDAVSIKFYQDAFDLAVADTLDFDSFRLIYLSNHEGDFELELTLNKDQTSAYDLGDGYGHLALSVENLTELHAKLTSLKLQPQDIVEFAPGGELIARFFFIADPDGYQIEVIERGGRFK